MDFVNSYDIFSFKIITTKKKHIKTAKMCWQETIIDDIFQWVLSYHFDDDIKYFR